MKKFYVSIGALIFFGANAAFADPWVGIGQVSYSAGMIDKASIVNINPNVKQFNLLYGEAGVFQGIWLGSDFKLVTMRIHCQTKQHNKISYNVISKNWTIGDRLSEGLGPQATKEGSLENLAFNYVCNGSRVPEAPSSEFATFQEAMQYLHLRLSLSK